VANKITLSLWTEKSKFHKVAVGISVITSLLIIVGIFNPHIPPLLTSIANVLLLLGGIFSSTYLGLLGGGGIGSYSKDGELVLAENYLIIDAVKIPLTEIKYINLKMSPRNTRSILLQNNLITIGDINGNQYKRLFVVKTGNENYEVEEILNIWRTQGVGIYAYYNGI